jgi:hypothetical protein
MVMLFIGGGIAARVVALEGLFVLPPITLAGEFWGVGAERRARMSSPVSAGRSFAANRAIGPS